eukprot:s4794_g4.t2
MPSQVFIVEQVGQGPADPSTDHFDNDYRGRCVQKRIAGRRGPVWRRGRTTTQERTSDDIADFLLSGENDYASFQEICKNFDPPADPQQIRAVIERCPDRFTVNKDTVTVLDAQRKEAITCMIKKLVVRDMAHVEIDPNKACEHIYQAAHYALKATPCRVAQILGSVAKATLTYPDEVGKGVYPANMPLALACLIDRMVYLARKRGEQTGLGSELLEKALSPKLYDILLRRWVVGRIKGSQFLANMILLWERLGYFEAKDLDKCKQSLASFVIRAVPLAMAVVGESGQTATEAALLSLKACLRRFPPPVPQPNVPGAVSLESNPGSLGHPELCRRPCIYLLKGGACHAGRTCSFCHLTHCTLDAKLDQKQRRLLQKMSPGEMLATFLPHFRSRADETGLLHQAEPLIHLVLKELCHSGSEVAEGRHSRRFHAALSRMSLATLAKHMLEPFSAEVKEAFEALRQTA